MQIECNGQSRTLTAGRSVADLLRELELANRPVAVELNERVIPREQHASTMLASGDKVEVVTLVGGG